MFSDNEAAREHLEKLRWANGTFCPHCGNVQSVTRLQGNSHRPGLWQCNECREHFTVTVGTVMERSHIDLCKWVLAFHLMAASKKGMSASQLGRMLGITYKSAWFMSHRIREAMADASPAPLGGAGKVVEVDEAYHGKVENPVPSKHRKGRPYIKNGLKHQKRPIVALVERGGEARAVHVPQVTGKNIKAVLAQHVDAKSRLHTDESRLYEGAGADYATHETVNHGGKEFVRGDVTTNTVEGFFSVFKRGMVGVYQHCGEQHFQRYLNEFTFRYNSREKLGVNDSARASRAIKAAEGKRLTYRRISGN
jgi:transposase-like protein